MTTARVPYGDNLTPEDQVGVEEDIAATIYDSGCGASDHEAADLARSILYHVLRRFRRDLFTDYEPGQGE